MGTSNLLGSVDGVVQQVQNAVGSEFVSSLKLDPLTVIIVLGVAVALYIVQALLVGALARGKGYSFLGNFLLGLLLGVVALVYEAGRPVSYERECVMQDRLAMQTAKELYKLQRAREKAHAGTISKPRTVTERPLSD